ncbi:hypothetical protein B0I37DRAFT_354784 [Chaetomium sp. MPI-CAGE-AT-0009]|nr:hypothetical protein B0I37DRAFT_354784 [Chaetomium sp. MPI-CAGE-AT-0009]
MPRRLRSFRTGFHRHGNVKAREGSEEQGQDGVRPNPHSHLSVRRLVASRRPIPPTRIAPPPACPYDFGPVPTMTLNEETELAGAYEMILSWQLQDGPGPAVPESQPNTIAQDNSDAKTAREAKVKEGLGVAVDVCLAC